MDSNKRNITIALMVAMFMGAIEGTVVTTAIPTIVKDLSGFGLISWVFSAYFLTSSVSTPIYGKLADVFGRKNVLFIGIGIFLVGSCLCGLSQNMHQLIAFRALQGLGAGSIFTVTYTIVGDIFTLADRAKVQGWLNAVWGIASVIGPFVGGFLIDVLSWHWVFFINVPFGILCIILLQKYFQEEEEKKRPSIDYAGILVLSVAIITLLLGVPSGGKQALLSLAFMCILLLIFYYIEKNAREPVIPFAILTRNNTVINLISFLAAAVLIGADVYMPVYIQNILSYSPTISGLAMAPMSVSWLLSAFILARAIPEYGERTVTGAAMLVLLLGTLPLLVLGIKSPLIIVVISTFIMGFGFGGCFTTMTIAIQASVDYNQRGAVTGLNSLVRSLGQTIAIGIFGGVFNRNIVNYFVSQGITGVDPNTLYSLPAGLKISLQNVAIAVNSALHIIIKLFIIITLVCLLLSILLPSNLKEKDSDQRKANKL